MDDYPESSIQRNRYCAMIVVIAGMPRSGSTFSFNVARDILVRRGTVFQGTHVSVPELIARSEGADHVLCKAHSFDTATIEAIRRGDYKAIITVRRPEDAIASWLHTFGGSLEPALAQMRAWLDLFRAIGAYSLVISYETVDWRPWAAARHIGRYIDPRVGMIETARIAVRHAKWRVKAKADKLRDDDPTVRNAGFTYYDEQTFFHRRHVSGWRSRRAAETLSKETVLTIRRELAAYVDKRGRLVES